MASARTFQAVEELVLSEFVFPDALEDLEAPPALKGRGAEEAEEDLAAGEASEPPLSFLSRATEREHPEHEEQLWLVHRVRRGVRAAEVLAAEAGGTVKAWRLWARGRALGRDGEAPVPLRELPRPLRREVEVLLDGEAACVEAVERNLRLVVAVAKRYLAKVPGAELEALVAEGTLGLMRALDLFDPSLGHRFSTYAFYWIRQTITRHLSKDHLVYLPEEQRRRAASGDRELSSLQAPLSLEEPLPDSDGGTLSLGDALASESDPAAAALRAWRAETLRKALRAIGPLHGLVLGLHSGVLGEEPLPLQAVAEILDLSVDQAERLHEEAKRRLRHYLEVRGLEDLAVD